MTALGLDTERAAGFAAAASRWADELHRLRSGHRGAVETLVLGGAEPRAADLLDHAARELSTAAAFVRLTTVAVSAADALGSSPPAASAVLAAARRHVELARPGRTGVTTGPTGHDASSPTDLARLLAELAPHEAVDRWSTLDPADRADVIARHPEIVALRVLAHDRDALTSTEIDLIADANRHTTLTTGLHGSFELDAGVRVVGVSIGAEVSAIVSRTNGPQVEMILMAGADLGGGLGPDVPLVGGATIAAGLVGRIEDRFVFADADAADAALRRLRAAARADTSSERLLARVGGLAWNTFASLQRATGTPLGPLPLPSVRHASAIEGTIDELRATNGTATTERSGRFAGADVGFDGDLALVDVALDVDARTELLTYDTTAGPLATEAGRSGVVWSGRLRSSGHGFAGDVLGPVVGALGRRADLDLAYVVDLARTDDGSALAEITLTGDGAVGPAVELLDLPLLDGGGIGVEQADLSTDTATVVITAPVDASTTSDLAHLVGALAAGRLPTRGLHRLADAAELEITASRASTRVVEAGGAVGPVEAGARVTRSVAPTTVALHRRPGGPIYARRDVDAAIDGARDRDVSRPTSAPRR